MIAEVESAPDRGTQLSEERTSLAIERSFLAFERTLMAWLRTSLSLISFGFTLAKFFQYLATERGTPVAGPFGRTWASDTVGLVMVAIGTFAMVAAVIQHRSHIGLNPLSYAPLLGRQVDELHSASFLRPSESEIK